MPGDYSRFTFDPKKRFDEVLAQQGRVDLDSDRNELAEILTRADRLRAFDVFGKAAVPRACNPDAFKITPSGNDLKLGAGRMYVDGILAEIFDDETFSYLHQPFFNGIPAPNQLNGQVLAYLDLWQREITYVEDPDLLDSALGGVDTAARRKTIWQVKLAQNLNCESDLDAAFPATNAKLTVSVAKPKDPVDPCLLPETGGFTDLENRHYRVEIHVRPGSEPNPGNYLKFARDPIAIEIEKIETSGALDTTFVVKSVGRDSVLRVSKGDTIEFTNEDRVLLGMAGTIGRVTDVDDGARLVTIDQVVLNADVKKELRPRLIVWHQKGQGTELLLPLDTSAPIPLEANISIEIKGTIFHHGDYWMFAARAANGTAGPLVNAPPYAIVHHYAPLATLTINSGQIQARDCRTIWPPECDCECAACVNEDDHADGSFTIQMAIDKVKKLGGGKVCIQPGTYKIEKSIDIVSASALSLVGHGDATIEYNGEDQQAILIESSAEIVVESLTIRRNATIKEKTPQGQNDTDAAAILIRNCLLDVIVRNCTLILAPILTQGYGVAFAGAVLDARVLDCFILAGTGVGALHSLNDDNKLAVAILVEVADSIIITSEYGVLLIAEGVAVTVRDNWIVVFKLGGIELRGTTDPGFANVIERNRISAVRTGITVAADRTTIANNSVIGHFSVDRKAVQLANANDAASAIALYTESDDALLETCHITGNRLREVFGAGILVAGRTDGCMIKQNFINETSGGGIVLRDTARQSRITIENNELRDVALGVDKKLQDGAIGIRVAGSSNATIVENTIDGVGLPFQQGREPVIASGIAVDAPDIVRIHGNRIANVIGARTPSAGIRVRSPIGSIEVTSNIVHVAGAGDPTGQRHAYALLLDGAEAKDLPYKWINLGGEFLPVYLGQPLRVMFWTDGQGYVAATPARRACNVRANELRAVGLLESKRSIVLISDRDINCTFGGNICDGSTIEFGVRLVASTIVADSNQVLAGGEVSLIVDTKRNANDTPRWTVLGNITFRQIQMIPSDGATNWFIYNRQL